MTTQWQSPTDRIFDEWAQGRLTFQLCEECGTAQNPPGSVCDTCQSRLLTYREVGGDATLVSWSTVHRAPSAKFADLVPYLLLMVRLDEGAMVEAPVIGNLEEEALSVNLRVKVSLHDHVGRAIPVVVGWSNLD